MHIFPGHLFGGRLWILLQSTCFNLTVCTAVFMCVQVHYILQEVVMGGMVLETNMNEIVAQVEVQNRMEKSEVSLLGPWKWFSIFHPVGYSLYKHPISELHFSFHFKPRVIFDRWMRLLSWQLGSVPFTLMLMFWNQKFDLDVSNTVSQHCLPQSLTISRVCSAV